MLEGVNYKDIPDYEGLYAVTDDGRVWSYRSKKFLKLYDPGEKYLYIHLSKNGTVKNFRVNRLVALAFIPNPNPENLPHVGHKDDNRTNNHVSNLYWTDAIENNNRKDRAQRLSSSNSKAVRCIETGEIFKNANAAAKAIGLTNGSGISRCCCGKRKTAANKHWEFVDEASLNRGKHRAVYCVELDRVFKNANEAAKETGAQAKCIRKVCRGEYGFKSANGYTFKYIEE